MSICIVCCMDYRYDGRPMRLCDACGSAGIDTCEALLEQERGSAARGYDAALEMIFGESGFGDDPALVDRWIRFLDEYHTVLRLSPSSDARGAISEASVIALEKRIRIATEKGGPIGNCISAFIRLRSVNRRIDMLEDDHRSAHSLV